MLTSGLPAASRKFPRGITLWLLLSANRHLRGQHEDAYNTTKNRPHHYIHSFSVESTRLNLASAASISTMKILPSSILFAIFDFHKAREQGLENDGKIEVILFNIL